jgi:hypothetical protein
MENSIALPVFSEVDAICSTPRCFVVYPEGYQEVIAYPFTSDTLTGLRNAYEDMRENGEFSGTWYTTLFFPEAWPPGLIYDSLRDYSWPEPGPDLE